MRFLLIRNGEAMIFARRTNVDFTRSQSLVLNVIHDIKNGSLLFVRVVVVAVVAAVATERRWQQIDV
jgi:hypothetical protein